jgi:hypothetical protein
LYKQGAFLFQLSVLPFSISGSRKKHPIRTGNADSLKRIEEDSVDMGVFR